MQFNLVTIQVRIRSFYLLAKLECNLFDAVYVDCVLSTPPGQTTTTTAPPEVSCQGEDDFQLIEHPTLCAFFFMCISKITFKN